MDVMKWYRAERWLYLHKLTPLAMVIKGSIRILWGGVIPYQATIGKGTKFTYQGLGVVIHKKAVIGNDCIIRQHVTLGGGGGPEGLPVIGDNVEIGAGTVIVGGVHIGNNVRIGANSFVNKDLPDNCTAVGTPAMPVKFNTPEN
ncbi:MAG: serine acetyltransferase [Clostridiales bacterium]|nr:serine acetyltransferase [Clostridiales bacterium]